MQLKTPAPRAWARRLGVAAVATLTLGAGVADSLYGFRVYPVRTLVEIMRGHRWMRRFDFDPEASVRLCWRGLIPTALKRDSLIEDSPEG